MGRIIACVDGSMYGASVCDHAAWASKRSNSAVEVIHVVERQFTTLSYSEFSGTIGFGAQDRLVEELIALDEQRNQLLLQRGTALLDEALAHLRLTGVEHVVSHCAHGSLVDSVTQRETDANLIVLGKRGEAADFDRLHLGGNVERVVRAARRPVLVASRAFKPISRLLVAFDGGSSSRKALECACSDPLLAGIERHVVMAAPASASTEGHIEWAREKLISTGEPYTLERRPGEPETVIRDYVRDQAIDLLVMGAYGHSRIRQLIVGSTTTEMVRTCLVPVLLYR